MRTRMILLAVIWLVFAASSLAQAGDREPAPPRIQPVSPVDKKPFWIDPVNHNQYFVGVQQPSTASGAIPTLPRGTSPPVVLPSDPAAKTAAGVAAVGREVTQPATIRAAGEVSVNARVSGLVTRVLVELGDVVKKDQVLATLDRTEYELKAKRAEAWLERAKAAMTGAEAEVKLHEAEVGRAEAAVKQAEAERKYRKQTLERLRGLLQTQAIDQRLVDEGEGRFRASEAQVEQANAALRVAQTGLAKAKAGGAVAKNDVVAAEADRQLTRFYVEATEIRAPAAGTVVAQHVQVGDAVGPARTNGRPAPLFGIADLTQLEAVARVPDKDLASLKPGQKCEVRVDAFPGVVYTGKVSHVAPVVSPRDRTAAVHVKLDLPKDGHRVTLGMYGTLRILAKE